MWWQGEQEAAPEAEVIGGSSQGRRQGASQGSRSGSSKAGRSGSSQGGRSGSSQGCRAGSSQGGRSPQATAVAPALDTAVAIHRGEQVLYISAAVAPTQRGTFHFNVAKLTILISTVFSVLAPASVGSSSQPSSSSTLTKASTEVLIFGICQ